MNENNKLIPEPKLEVGRDKKYEGEVIQDSVVYANKVKDQLSKLYYVTNILPKIGEHLGARLSSYAPLKND